MGLLKWLKSGDWINPLFNTIACCCIFFGAIYFLQLIIESDNEEVIEKCKAELRNETRYDEVLIQSEFVDGGFIDIIHSESCPYIEPEYCEICSKASFKKKPNSVYDGCLSGIDTEILNLISRNNINSELKWLLMLCKESRDSFFISDLVDNSDISNRTYTVYYNSRLLNYSKLSKPLNTIEYNHWESKEKKDFIKRVYGYTLDEWFDKDLSAQTDNVYLKEYDSEK